MIKGLSRYAAVGGVATAAHYALLVALVEWAAISPGPAAWAGAVLGALVASLLVGIVNAWGVLALPGWSVVLTFLCMAVVLIVRPWGLFGSQE